MITFMISKLSSFISFSSITSSYSFLPFHSHLALRLIEFLRNEDIEYEQNNQTKDSDDSNDSLSSLSKRPSCEYE